MVLCEDETALSSDFLKSPRHVHCNITKEGVLFNTEGNQDGLLLLVRDSENMVNLVLAALS